MGANPDLIDFFKDVPTACSKCKSMKVLVFVETRIKGACAWACWKCHYFEVLGTRDGKVDNYFKERQLK